MLSKANNELLTQVTGDAPMASLMAKHCWLPFAREESLQSGQPPEHVRLLGRDFVAFRTGDGDVGLVDERCPHRGVSLALARVEHASLRCIYHGWRIAANGAVEEVPSEGENSTEFARRVKFNHYPIREAGGLVWTFLGGKEPPELPRLPIMDVPPESRWISRTLVPCNWLQGLEGAVDSAHLGWLHKSWIDGAGIDDAEKFEVSPVYQTLETHYGMRNAAIRHLSDGKQFLRVAEYIYPGTVLLQTDRPASGGTEYACFMAVPVDDENHILFWCIWSDGAPLDKVGFSQVDYDLDNYAPPLGSREDRWGQDRSAINAGHFTGITDLLLREDTVVHTSMGKVTDRRTENLCGTDVAIANTRRLLLELLKRHERGEELDSVFLAYNTHGALPFAGINEGNFDWKDSSV